MPTKVLANLAKSKARRPAVSAERLRGFSRWVALAATLPMVAAITLILMGVWVPGRAWL